MAVRDCKGCAELPELMFKRAWAGGSEAGEPRSLADAHLKKRLFDHSEYKKKEPCTTETYFGYQFFDERILTTVDTGGVCALSFSK